jgi:hypothetical protein
MSVRDDELDEFGIGGAARGVAVPQAAPRSQSGFVGAPNFFLPGDYEVVIDSVSASKGLSGEPILLVETTVTKSSEPQLPVGASPAWVTNLGSVSAAASVRGFLSEAYGTSDANVTADLFNLTVSPKQPLRGERMGVLAIPTTSKRGKTFTKLRWRKL